MESFIWGDAQVTYPDWRGTAQLDQRMTGPQLNEIVGLDSSWFVIGMDLGGGEHRHSLHVIAAPMDQIHGDATGDVEATDFLIHDVDPYEVLRAMTHVFELRMRRGRFNERQIRIVAYGDVPEQSD